MIDLIFSRADEIIFVRIKGNNITFRNSSSGMLESSIDGLRFIKTGVVKEFPDLKDNPEWDSISKARFKDKIKSMENEDDIADYILSDLKKHEYKPMWKQKQGFRREKIG